MTYIIKCLNFKKSEFLIATIHSKKTTVRS